MSKVKARTDPTPASPEEQSSRAVDLYFEIETKLTQAKGICGLLCGADANAFVPGAADAALDLIDGVEKALDELQASSTGAPRRRCNHEQHDRASCPTAPSGAGFLCAH